MFGFRWLSLVLILSVVLAPGCKKSADKKSGLSGRVTINGSPGVDVIVQVYDEPRYDNTELWYYAARNPQAGFAYSAPAVFDWRRDGRFERATTHTDADGRFNVTDLEDNNYVVSARLDGFGWSIPRMIELRGSDLEIGNIALFPDSTIDRTSITGDVVWPGDGRHYLLTRDLNIAAGASLTIEAGAVVRIDEFASIVINGTFNATGTPEQYVAFTSSLPLPSAYDWDGIELRPGANRPVFRYCRFDDCDPAVNGQGNSATFDHCYFSNHATQALNLNSDLSGDSLVVDHCVFDHVGIGLRAFGMSKVDVSHSMFFSCRTYAISFAGVRSGEIFCNWFQDCGRFDTTVHEPSGVMLLSDVQSYEIHNNMILDCAYALDLGSKVDSTVLIDYNMFQGVNRVMNVGVTEQQLGPSYPLFTFNCMISIDKINVIVNSCHINTHNIDCTSNFWNNSSEDVVYRTMVQDCHADPEGHFSVVNISPILTSCPSNTGLCPTN
jgi:hypothetical protein